MTTHQTERGAAPGVRRRGESVDSKLARVPASSNGNGTARSTTAYKLAKGLGWFSIGLGLAELLATRNVARLIGAKGNSRAHTSLRVLGLVELVGGVAILSRTRRSKSAGSNGALSHPLTVTAAITINRPKQEVYEFWRNFENLPGVLSHLESVRVEGEQSHWRAKLPAGLELEWSAQIQEDKPNEAISWRSLPGGILQNHGRVSFKSAPGDQGTELHVLLGFEPLGGAVGTAFAKLFGALPAQQLRADLKRLKQVLETGSVVRSDASVHRGPHPARPAEAPARHDNGESRVGR